MLKKINKKPKPKINPNPNPKLKSNLNLSKNKRNMLSKINKVIKIPKRKIVTLG